MTPSFRLHRSSTKADWEYVSSSKQNTWQRLAANSRGILTPGNILSVGGALVVVIGLIQLAGEITLGGLFLIGIGRLGDIFDGLVAEKTGTKSPLGEILDAGLDKILAFVTLAILITHALVPLGILIAIGLHGLANSAIAIRSKFKKISMHPSREGKYAMALSWIVMIGYLFYQYLQSKETSAEGLNSLLLMIIYVLFALYIFLATRSTADYYRQLKNIRVKKNG